MYIIYVMNDEGYWICTASTRNIVEADMIISDFMDNHGKVVMMKYYEGL